MGGKKCSPCLWSCQQWKSYFTYYIGQGVNAFLGRTNILAPWATVFLT